MPLKYGIPDGPLGVVAFGVATNSISSASTTPVITVTSSTWVADPKRRYKLWTSPLHWQSTIATDLGQWELKLGQNGTAPVATGARLTGVAGPAHIANSARGDPGMMVWHGKNLSGVCQAIITFYRAAGTGTCTTPTANLRPRQLVVVDMGIL